MIADASVYPLIIVITNFFVNKLFQFVFIVIYEDKVLNVIWGEEPIAILIASKTATESYRQYFSMLWKIAKT